MLVNVGKSHDTQLMKQLKAYLAKHNMDIPITCRQRYDVESDKNYIFD